MTTWEEDTVQRLRAAATELWLGRDPSDQLDRVLDDFRWLRHEVSERGERGSRAEVQLLDRMVSRLQSARNWIDQHRSFGRAKVEVSHALALMEEYRVRFGDRAGE